MVIGWARIHLRLAGSYSLKDKRRVIRSVMDRARRAYGISVAEVADHDLWNCACIGITITSNQVEHAQSVLTRAIELFEGNSQAVTECVESDLIRV